MFRAHFLPAALTVTVLAASACGSSSLSPETAPNSSGAPVAASQTANPALAAKLPAKVKSAGEIVVGVDATYPPNEFLGPDGKSVQGLDVDLFNAVAQKFGVTVDWKPSAFDAVLLGVGSGRFDMGVSSLTINPERKKAVNMVSYYKAGTLWVVPKGNPKKVDANNACGLNVGVQKGTVQIDDLNARSKKCTAAGKPAINQVVDEQQVKVTAALTSGKVDAMAADSPIGLYAVQQTNGALEKLGEVYDSAPYGLVVPKAQTEFAAALAQALKELETSGDYRKILEKWNAQEGAVSSFAVNP